MKTMSSFVSPGTEPHFNGNQNVPPPQWYFGDMTPSASTAGLLKSIFELSTLDRAIVESSEEAWPQPTSTNPIASIPSRHVHRAFIGSAENLREYLIQSEIPNRDDRPPGLSSR